MIIFLITEANTSNIKNDKNTAKIKNKMLLDAKISLTMT